MAFDPPSFSSDSFSSDAWSFDEVDVRVSWLQFDTLANPVDVKVSWLQFGTQATAPTNVKVSWFEFNTVGTAYETRVSWFQFNPMEYPASAPLSYRGQVFSKTLDVSTVATIVESAFAATSKPSVFWVGSYVDAVVARATQKPLLITTRSQRKALPNAPKTTVIRGAKHQDPKPSIIRHGGIYASAQTTSDHASVRDTSVRVSTKQADMFVTGKPKRQALKSSL